MLSEIKELKQIYKDLNALTNDKTSLLRLLSPGKISEADYEVQYELINKKRKLLQIRQNELNSLISKDKETDENLHMFQKEINNFGKLDISNFGKLDISDEELLSQVLQS